MKTTLLIIGALLVVGAFLGYRARTGIDEA